MSSSLTEELLSEAAAASAGGVSRSWLARLSKEHRDAVENARDSWRKMPASGISATALARVIVSKMEASGYKMPGAKQVQRWLTLE